MEELFGQKPGAFSDITTGIFNQFLKIWYRLDGAPVKLAHTSSEFLPGLDLIEVSKTKNEKLSQNGILYGTVRMGYGHHRMAYAAYTHTVTQKPSYLFDLLTLETNESRAVADIDHLYSTFSRIASETGGAVEEIWGQMMTKGGSDSLYFSYEMAKSLTGLVDGINKKVPAITAYPLLGHILSCAGFKHIFHLINDNMPQYFLLVPGAKNLVQTKHMYDSYKKMGVPGKNLEYAGHWVSKDVHENAATDSGLRSARRERKSPLRVLIPVGGAGAQKKYLLELIQECKELLQKGDVVFYINCGDHKDFYASLQKELTTLAIERREILTSPEMENFIAANPLDQDPDATAVNVFHFKSHFEAFRATDRLIRISDVMATKPSELAFYPIPKIFLRRVGDHEAFSAEYSNDLGEGTPECRTTEEALARIKAQIQGENQSMNEKVIRFSEEGLYEGAKKAVEMASRFTSDN